MANAIFSFQLQDQNRKAMERKKEESGWPFGRIINTLLDTFAVLPDSVKKDLTEHIKQTLHDLINQMNHAEEHEYAELMEIARKYLDIASYLNDGKELSLTDISRFQLLQKISLKNGLLICPKSYVIVNSEEAPDMEYACVVECRNATRYNVPHYLIFCDRKYSADYDDNYKSMLIKKLLDHHPDFQRIMDAQVKPIYDPEMPGKLLNANACSEAPAIGLFSVYEHGDLLYPADYMPPDGTEIIRNDLLDQKS